MRPSALFGFWGVSTIRLGFLQFHAMRATNKVSKAVEGEVNSITFVTFKDDDRHHSCEGEDFNKIGYATRSGLVLHLQGRRLVASSKERIKHLRPKAFSFPFPAADCEAAEFFLVGDRRIPIFSFHA